jgi:hypothetical protein
MKEKISINESHILTLCENSSDSNLYIKYNKILKPIDENTDSLLNLLLTENIDNQKLILLIKKHLKELKLINYINYCSDINESYQNIILKKEFIERNLERIDERIATKKELIKSKLFHFLTLKKEGLTFNKTLNHVIEDSKNLMYSHRVIGWNIETYKINSKFNVKVNSNFGYAPVNYFYTLLNFDGIDIIPYSEFIEYRYAGFIELNKYSKKHLLTDDSWLESFNYIIEATTIYNKSERSFIEKYLIKECEKLVEGLDFFSSNSKFNFTTRYLKKNKYGQKKYSTKTRTTEEFYKKRKLKLFRAEKITGALQFISSINNYKEIFEVNSFVNRIEILNKKIHPMMLIETEKIKLEMDQALIKQIKLENELESEKTKFETANDVYKEILLKYNIGPSNEKLKYLEKSEFYNFQKKYPNFGKKHSEYNELKKLVYTNNLLVFELKNQEKEMNNFIENFKQYFRL